MVQPQRGQREPGARPQAVPQWEQTQWVVQEPHPLEQLLQPQLLELVQLLPQLQLQLLMQLLLQLQLLLVVQVQLLEVQVCCGNSGSEKNSSQTFSANSSQGGIWQNP